MEIKLNSFGDVIHQLESQPFLREGFNENQLETCRLVVRREAEQGSGRPFRIAFCGVFSSGKTSLINALLGCQPELPVGINPITKLVTRIRYGREVTCTYRWDGREHRLAPDETAAFIRGETQIEPDDDEIVIAMPARLLQGGIELIDTPGFDDEMGGKLELMSRNALAGADMAVMCCSALQLGKLTERTLLEDLDTMMGYFMFAVTRMDNLRRQRDIGDVLAKAQWLMKDRGDSAGISPDGENRVFPMTASTENLNLGDFRDRLTRLLDDQEARSAIQTETDLRRRDMCSDWIEDWLDMVMDRLSDEYEELKRKNQDDVRRRAYEAQVSQDAMNNAVTDSKTVVKAFASDRLSELRRQFDTITDPALFQADATVMVRDMMAQLTLDIASYGEKHGFGDAMDIRKLMYKAFDGRAFSVPRAQKERVQTRGAVGRGLATLVNFATRNYTVDDGCDYVYGDYKTPALRAVLDGPVRWVLDAWLAYAVECATSAKAPVPKGRFEDAMKDKQREMKMCGRVGMAISGLRRGR